MATQLPVALVVGYGWIVVVLCYKRDISELMMLLCASIPIYSFCGQRRLRMHNVDRLRITPLAMPRPRKHSIVVVR